MNSTLLLAALIVLAAAASTYTYLNILRRGAITSSSTTARTSATTAYVSSSITNVSTGSLKPLKRVITVSVTDSLLKYVEWRYYPPTLLTSGSSETLKHSLSEEIKENFSEVKPINLSIKVYPNDSVRIEFEVSGKVWLSNGEKHADFLWLLTPLGLDFIESHFNETNHSLYWTGKINSISTEVDVLLPQQSTIYRAWGNVVGHCHGHVWWPVKP